MFTVHPTEKKKKKKKKKKVQTYGEKKLTNEYLWGPEIASYYVVGAHL